MKKCFKRHFTKIFYHKQIYIVGCIKVIKMEIEMVEMEMAREMVETEMVREMVEMEMVGHGDS